MIVVFFALFSWGQEEPVKTTAVDSLKTNMRNEGITITDSLVSKRKVLNPLAPAKAGFYSAVIPGLGQAYNKRYWKIPIVWAAIGTGIYAYTFYDNQYDAYRSAFKNRKVGLPFEENPFVSISPSATDQQLERLQDERQNDRDLALLVTILMYALNVVDANVDAHLKQFNIDDDLSMDMQFQPYLEVNPINNNPHYGMALTVKF